MRVHFFPDDALSMEIPCIMCHLEHKDCSLDDCQRPHMYVLTSEEMNDLFRAFRRKEKP